MVVWLLFALACGGTPSGRPPTPPGAPELTQAPAEPVHTLADGQARPAVDPALLNAERALLGTGNRARAPVLLDDTIRRFPAHDLALSMRAWLEDLDGGHEQEFLRRVDPLRAPIWGRYFAPDGAPAPIAALAPYFAESVRRGCADAATAAMLEPTTCSDLPDTAVPADYPLWHTLTLTSHQSGRLGDWSPNGRRRRATDLLVDLEVAPGMAVADLGAADGWFTLPVARLVGAAGRVVAQDAEPSHRAFVEGAAAALGYRNVTTVADAAGLPAGAFDRVLVVDPLDTLYTEAQGADPAYVDAHVVPYLRAVERALKPDGRAVFVLRQSGPAGASPVRPDTLLRDLARVGLVQFDELDEYGPGAAVMVFERATAPDVALPAAASPAPTAPPAPAG